MSNVLILGSTGMIGSSVSEEARSRGFTVTDAARTAGEGRISLDATNVEALADALEGQDALISAISPPRDGSDPVGPLLDAGRSMIAAARAAGTRRVLVVGGAGSLLLPDGSMVVDQDWFPQEVRGEALAQGELLDLWRTGAEGLDWSYLSPAAQIGPGERTGNYTLGADHLVATEEGVSAISVPDFAKALIDELEQGAHIGRRFTLAYT